ALSLINTINSIVGVDLATFEPQPSVAGKSSHGGYCGPAVKPIALHLVSAVAGDPKVTVPISGIGRIASWRDAAEFIALGARTARIRRSGGSRDEKRETGNVVQWSRSSKRPALGAISARWFAPFRTALP